MADIFSGLNISFNLFSGRLAIISAIIIVVGFLIILLLFINCILARRGEKEGIGLIQKIFVLLISLLFITTGSAMLMTAMHLQAYKAFTHKEMVGVIDARKAKGLDYDIFLRFTPVDKDKKSEEKIYKIKGDQWSIGGDILKFDDWLNFIGIHTGYKTTRIHGRYLKAEDESIKQHTAYDINGGTDAIWLYLYENSRRFPFVKAVYGNSVYAFPSDDDFYEAYVTTSGYSIEKIKDNKRR
ncbi:MAG: hypothetical protein HY034_04775 [Nitrospirae bacterium]|nr:hypothetical protein [Nitrospirota bacterium]